MRSLSELKTELADLEYQLEKITIKKSGSSPWAPGVYDQHKSNSYSYNEYTDYALATQLQESINKIKYQIANYAELAQAERENIAFQEKKTKEAEEKKISEDAKKLYEDALLEYHKKSLLGKVNALFKGKKPKKNLSDEEIDATYGAEAEYQMKKQSIDKRIKELEEQRKQQIEWYKTHETKYDHLPIINAMIDKEIAELNEQLEIFDKKRKGTSK